MVVIVPGVYCYAIVGVIGLDCILVLLQSHLQRATRISHIHTVTVCAENFVNHSFLFTVQSGGFDSHERLSEGVLRFADHLDFQRVAYSFELLAHTLDIGHEQEFLPLVLRCLLKCLVLSLCVRSWFHSEGSFCQVLGVSVQGKDLMEVLQLGCT